MIGTSQSRVSRIELAKLKAKLDLVARWLDATGADEQARREVLGLAEQSLVEMESYRPIFRGSIATGQRIALEQDDASTRIRHFQPSMIPGLLQSEAYARAALASVRKAGERGLEEAVATMMERGRRIRESGAARYEFVLVEQALRWVPAGLSGGTELHELWRHVLDATEARNLTVQLIPAGTPMTKSPLCGYVITEFRPELGMSPIVQVELPAVDLMFSSDQDVATFELSWQHMRGDALSPQQSAQYIEQMLRG